MARAQKRIKARRRVRALAIADRACAAPARQGRPRARRRPRSKPRTQARPGLDPPRLERRSGGAHRCFMLASFDGDEAAFAERLDALLPNRRRRRADRLLRGLPLYPAPDLLVAAPAKACAPPCSRCSRRWPTAIPTRRERSTRKQWNQMVVKALFIGSRLAPIQGLDARRNPTLAAHADRLRARALGGRTRRLARAVALRRPLRRAGRQLADLARCCARAATSSARPRRSRSPNAAPATRATPRRRPRCARGIRARRG